MNNLTEGHAYYFKKAEIKNKGSMAGAVAPFPQNYPSEIISIDNERII